jgi:hypothetical protein
VTDRTRNSRAAQPPAALCGTNVSTKYRLIAQGYAAPARVKP